MTQEDYLQLSGLQHFVFCKRQWALIHIEQQWADNLRTVEGDLLHETAHSKDLSESRGDLLIIRGLRVFSHTLGISGQCDVVEFHRSENGVRIEDREGLWKPFPVEYKRGKPKEHRADELQLCAQAICLEQMLLCEIEQGALFYGEPRRRTIVEFSDELRSMVRDSLEQMHQYHDRGYTPKVKPSKSCNACSLKELCVPKLIGSRPVADYLRLHMGDDA